MNEPAIANGKTEVIPLEFEFEAVRTAIENLVRKLREHGRDDVAHIVNVMHHDLDGACKQFHDHVL
jgi:hypothetical protein